MYLRSRRRRFGAACLRGRPRPSSFSTPEREGSLDDDDGCTGRTTMSAPTVMIADDDEMIRAVVRDGLEN
ncbi:hypothetical protein ACFT1B_36705, partial [Streptomyces griseoincarnatus]